MASSEYIDNKGNGYGDGENNADNNDHTNITRSLSSFCNTVMVFVRKTLQKKGKNNALMCYHSDDTLVLATSVFSSTVISNN